MGKTLQAEAGAGAWPKEGWTRIPFWIYTDPDLFQREMDTFFYGPSWNYVGLDCEIPEPGSFKRSWIGERQVVVRELLVALAGQRELLVVALEHRDPELAGVRRHEPGGIDHDGGRDEQDDADRGEHAPEPGEGQADAERDRRNERFEDVQLRSQNKFAMRSEHGDQEALVHRRLRQLQGRFRQHPPAHLVHHEVDAGGGRAIQAEADVPADRRERLDGHHGHDGGGDAPDHRRQVSRGPRTSPARPS